MVENQIKSNLMVTKIYRPGSGKKREGSFPLPPFNMNNKHSFIKNPEKCFKNGIIFRPSIPVRIELYQQ